MKVLVAAFNQGKALEGAFSVIIKLQTSHRFVSNSTWSTRSPDAEEEEEVTEAEAADGEVVEAVVAGGWKGKKPGRQPWARPHPSTSSTQGSLITLRVTLCYNRDTRDSPPSDLT